MVRNGLIFFSLSFLILMHGYTGRDDSHITYFVADQLSENNIFVNYNYTNLEQSSTLAFTVLLAIVGKLTGLESSHFAPFISCSLLFIVAVTIQALSARFNLHRLTGLATSSLPILYWANSGMENSLYAFLILLLVFYLSRLFMVSNHKTLGKYNFKFGNIRFFDILSLIILTLVICATRPEASLVLGCSIVMLILFHKGNPAIIEIAFFIVIGICLFYLLRIGLGFDMFPNTVSAKQGRLDFTDRILKGCLYIISLFRDAPFSTIGIFLSIGCVIFNNKLQDGPFREVAIVACCVSLSIILFAFFSGGDWMELGRFVTVAILLSIMVMINVVWLNFGTKGVFVVYAMLLFEHSVFILYSDYRTGSSIPLVEINENFSFSDLEAYNTVHSRDLSFLNKMIPVVREDKNSSVTIAANQAGMVPYYLRQNGLINFSFIDLIGLTTDIGRNCRSQWKDIWPAWQNIREWEQCLNRKINYFYDVDDEALTRLRAVESQGCTRVFLDRIEVKPFLKLKPYTYHQFLVRC